MIADNHHMQLQMRIRLQQRQRSRASMMFVASKECIEDAEQLAYPIPLAQCHYQENVCDFSIFPVILVFINPFLIACDSLTCDIVLIFG